jgi:hypothetical protein
VAKLNLLNRMPPQMFCADGGVKPDFSILFKEAGTQIDIFKPDGVELFIEAAEGEEVLCTEEQEGAGGLFDGLGSGEIGVQTPVPDVDRVGGP